MGDTILVNDFMFCRAHGDELCSRCLCDHRMCNNVRIESDVGDLAESGFDIEGRAAVNAFRCGAVYHSGAGDAARFRCGAHAAVDCPVCFDWVGMVRAEADAAVRREAWLGRRKKYYDRYGDD